MRSLPRLVTAALLMPFVVAGGFSMLHWGVYGWTLFLIVPFLLGGLGAFALQAKTRLRAAIIGALTVLSALSLVLLMGMDGLVCVLMAAPLAAPLGAFGGWMAFQIEYLDLKASWLGAFLVLPIATLAWDMNVRSPLLHVTTQIVVHATPEQVWPHVVSFAELPPPDEWIFHTGLAYPIRARIVGTGTGAVRYCQFSTGPFVEPITIWDQPHLLHFRVSYNPAPLNEWSPWGQILPRHLQGYFVSEQGQFHLTALPGGRTLLSGTTWYRHGLWPAEYWRWWSDAIIHRIHLRVLMHVRNLAEEEARR